MNPETSNLGNRFRPGIGRSSAIGIILMAAAVALSLLIILLTGFAITATGFAILMFAELCGTILLLGIFRRQIRSRQVFRRILFIAACVATLIALFYAEENWRGRRAWEQYQREWTAKGENFDLKNFTPPAVPADQNFAMSPVFVAEVKCQSPQTAELWYGKEAFTPEISNLVLHLGAVNGLIGTNRFSFSPKAGSPAPPEISPVWTGGHFLDLNAWQKFYRDFQETNPAAGIPLAARPQSPAQDVLLALSRLDPEIERLRADGARPYSRFPILYDAENPAMVLLPHLAVVRRISQILELRAVAELQEGQTNEAFADTELIFCLVRSVQTEPIIVTHLVRFIVLENGLQPVWEGLARHQWTETQLAAFESDLRSLDFPADYQRSIRAERDADAEMIDYIAARRGRFWEFLNIVTSRPNTLNRFHVALAVYLMPRGWFDRDKIFIARMDQQQQLPAVDPLRQQVFPDQADQFEKIRSSLRPTTADLAEILFTWPGFDDYAQKTAYAQNAANLARVAVALERYRLANGRLPDALNVLSPGYLPQVPHDVIGGEPLQYRQETGGQFILYSVGWNKTDDGGTIARGDAPGGVNYREGDWVWRYPQ